MTPIIMLLLVALISIVITRVATVALTHTGLSRQAARFQSRSALSGAGFTTAESENVVNHPVRRRIIMLLMLLGNAGLVTAVSSLILSFVDQGGSVAPKVTVLAAGLVGLWFLAGSDWVDRHLSRLIGRLLDRYTELEAKDYAGLMHLGGDYHVAEFPVEADHWLADKKLDVVRLRDEGVVVLGIARGNGHYMGIPRGGTKLRTGDTLVVYAERQALEKLDARGSGSSGDAEHEEAVTAKRRRAREERAEDAAAAGGEDR
ncbi:MAG: TrkA C-terminal domain-containing protein [Gammaproteobacteria bacterium]|nr:TrkA C-terminal domain-containing protein [Gammaproteobacteria bacterium]